MLGNIGVDHDVPHQSPISSGPRASGQAFVSRLDDFLLFKQGAEENPGGSYLPQASLTAKRLNILND